MGVFDFPLDELKKYMGINPRPDDFDDFWDNSLEEMKAVDPQPEMVPSGIECSFARCYSLYFNGTKGSRIHAKFIVPSGTERPVGAILKFHGYSGNSGDWTDGFQFIAAGYAYAALDCRGQRGLSDDRGTVSRNSYHGHIIRGLDDAPEDMTMRNIFLDTAKLAEVVMGMDIIDENRTGVFGVSQGGALATVCAALVPRVKKAAIILPFLSDYKRVWKMDLAAKAYEELSTYFRYYDPKHEREEEIFNKLGYIDVQHLARRIRADVMFVTGLMDTVCPPSTQFAIYNRINSEKRMDIYPDFTHETIFGVNDDVFSFLLGV